MKEFLLRLNEKDIETLNRCIELVIKDVKRSCDEIPNFIYFGEKLLEEVVDLKNNIEEQLNR